VSIPARRAAKGLALLVLVLAVSACGLPRSGPNKAEIKAGSIQQQGNAFIVGVDSRVTQITTGDNPLGFSSDFRNAGLIGSDTIAPGDILSLTIFENVRDDPLLGNTGQRVSGLDRVGVDGQGYIFVPYAGRIKAAGQTPDGLRQLITRKLETQTPDPQVTVNRAAGDGSTVTVSGAVSGQGVYPIERPTRTLSAMVARAGGVAIEPSSAIIRVTRGARTGQVWLQDLYDNPKLDIALRSGDTIVVERDRRAYTALGATGAQQFVPFETQTLSAVEALAQVGGLNSALADPKGIFVFRDEGEATSRSVLQRPDLQGDQRIVYVLDLTQPLGIFEARDFQIRDGDTVYVTEAPFVQWQKTINAITGTTNSANSVAKAATGI
jgi:polysaccharide biosynthesis/export protein